MDAATIRILDANLNRAREALRVIEDFARFVLDDADSARAAKELRHDLRREFAMVGQRVRLDARDAAGDVGRTTKTGGELARRSPDEVAAAEFARLAEALRSIGEYGKLVSPLLAPAAERVRFRSYELEQCVLLRGGARCALRSVRLYVIITAALCKQDWRATAAAVLAGGAECLQLREKRLADGELVRCARELRELTRLYGALLIINDRPDVARLCGADGVHVGHEDLSVAEARRIGGACMIVGKSTHTREQIDEAILEQPDYVAVGPMYASTTKPQARVAGIRTLEYAASRTELPIVAIGGLTARSAARVRRAGASCVCVCSAVIAARDPKRAASAIRRAAGHTK